MTWQNTGPGRWRFSTVTVPTPTPNNVTAGMVVDAFNNSPWAAGNQAVDAYDLDIVDHIPVDTETWEITGTVSLVRELDMLEHLAAVHDTGEPFPCEDCYFPH